MDSAIKACSIDVTEKHFIITCLHTTQVGGSIAGDPMTKLERETISTDSLGQAVLKVLEAPKRVLAVPVDYKTLTNAMVQFAGFKTWRAMYNATDLECFVVEDKDN
jgi:hypothetical protein